MKNLPARPEVFRVVSRFAPAIGLLVVLGPVAAQAQVNIDQGKTPAMIFANDCAACHKSTRGLATGRNSLMLTLFLREHYTTSREQAAALAAYVLGAGGAEPAAKPGQKPAQAKLEQPKAGEPKANEREAKPGEPKGEERSKPTARPGKPGAKPEPEMPARAEPEPEAPASAKLQPPVGEEGTRSKPEAPQATSPPAEVVATPSESSETPGTGGSGQDQSPTTEEAPAQSPSGDGEPVPRDNIPD
jgi:hypothetical protein